MSFIKSIILETVRWVYWFPLRMIIQRVPLRAGYALATLTSFMGFIFMKKKMRLTEQGLHTMFGGKLSEKQKKVLTRKTLENVFKRSIEALWYPKLTPDLCNRIFTFEGLEHLDTGLQHGRGVVLLHGHFGNPHMIMPALGYKGYTLNQLGSRNPPEKIKSPFMFICNWIRQRIYEINLSYKEALPVNFIYTDMSMKGAIQSLKNNEVLAIAIDGRESTKWMEIDFLNQKALFSMGTMNLILKMNPVVLPTIVIRQDDDTHKVILHAPMKLEFTGDKDKDIRSNTQNFLRLFEKYVMAYPYQYSDVFWFEDKFFKHV